MTPSSNWTTITTATNPPSSGTASGRFAYGMTSDLLRDRHVLFGGTATGPTLGDTWEFDGTDWSQRPASGPAGRTGPTFAYVPVLEQTFLFGGFSNTQLGDTWQYQTAAVATVASYGTGCSGPAGQLVLGSASAPWTNTTWQASCGTLGPTSLGLQAWGLGQVSVPLNPILPIAPPGCLLLDTADLLAGPLLPTGGQVSAQLPVPDVATLAGATLNLQIAELEFDLGGNFVGLYTSNGLSLTVGVR
jgi:hypothetical protein